MSNQLTINGRKDALVQICNGNGTLLAVDAEYRDALVQSRWKISRYRFAYLANEWQNTDAWNLVEASNN